MAESFSDRRARLFDLYSRHISLYEPDKQDGFWCPLCMASFGREALVGPKPALSLAHVIPDALGGNFTTLACASCNNGVGHRLEAALVERFAADDSAAGLGLINGRLSGSFGSVGVDFQTSPDRLIWSLYPVPRQSNPAELEALNRYLAGEGVGPEGDLHFTLRTGYRHMPRQASTAIYQSAYLLLFSYFGYEFVHHPHFTPLRDQLARPGERILPSMFPVLDEVSAKNLLDGGRHAVMMTRDPGAVVALLRFRSKAGRQPVFAVALPGLDDPNIPSLRGTFNGSVIPYCPEALLDTKFYFFQVWRYTRQVNRCA
jgi:hypothetical protein